MPLAIIGLAVFQHSGKEEGFIRKVSGTWKGLKSIHIRS